MNTAPKKIRCPSSLIRSQAILNTVIKLLLNFPLIFLVSFNAFLIPDINKYKPNKIASMGKKINLITPSLLSICKSNYYFIRKWIKEMLYIIYNVSLHKHSFRYTPQKRTLGRQGFKSGYDFCFMQLFIHPLYDYVLWIVERNENV